MKSLFTLLLLSLLPYQNTSSKEQEYPKAKVSFQDYKTLVEEVESHREKRLVDLNTFLEMSKKKDVIVLDTRSKFRFDRIHVKGAVHLNFSDFTQGNLAKRIPSPETTILIYCNNNFEGNPRDFASKIALPRPNPASITTQFEVQAKPRMMALNVPTYLNLYGYGYRNVYELNELVNVDDPRITFDGSILEPKKMNILTPEP